MIQVVLLSLVLAATPVSEGTEIHIQPELSTVKKVMIITSDAGTNQYQVTYRDGRIEQLSPDAFTQLIVDDNADRSWMKTIFNITTPFGLVWVGIGLLGQVLFTGRMIVQWIASEKTKRSVVPTAFWWMSLIGASMLITYFIWRKDVVGVLGQATGWFIYVRNLYLIYGHKKSQQLGEPPEGAEAAAE